MPSPTSASSPAAAAPSRQSMLHRLALPVLALAGGSLAVQPLALAASVEPSIKVEGSGFVLTLADGQVLRGVELTGASLLLAMQGNAVAPVKLASITPDPDRPDILRHDFQTADGKGGWQPACEPNGYGERWGFPVSLPRGHPGYEGEITISCASGALVKCARWGYPSGGVDKAGQSLLPMHAACVHMVRADYCGDDMAHTKNGTTIDYYDDLGIETRGAVEDQRFVFEAGWAPAGAVCVNHTRWSDLLTLDQLKSQCPRLAALPECSETSARAAGAKLFNTSRLLCGKAE